MPVLSGLMRAVGLAQDSQVPALAKNSPGQRDLSLVLPNDEFPVAMITGRAGTGKSTLVRAMAQSGGPGQVVLAPTGVAALNVEGQTIHSFFRLPLHIVRREDLRPIAGRIQLYRNLERIIIDEMSMVRADLLDAIDHSLQLNRENDAPFGGVKVVLIGDLLQLPPVVPNAEAEVLENYGYKTPYLVSAAVLQHLQVKFIDLPMVYRQDDEQFIQMLADIRVGANVESVVNIINECCYRPHRQTVTPIILTATNAQADFHNHDRLAALPGEASVFTGTLQGAFNLNEDKFPAPMRLELKVGARVILVKNDPEKQWVNGSLATVTRICPNSVWVLLDGETYECEVNREKWDKIEYRWSQAEHRIIPEAVGSYSQIPMKAAWAITIHKAQGLTLEDVRIDLGVGAFASGQAYVALSRVKSLSGLSLARRLTVADVWVDPTLLAVTEEIARRASAWVDI